MDARLESGAPRPVAAHPLSRRIEALWASPAWRLAKLILDAVLLLGIVWAVTWAATNGVFVAQRAYTNRSTVQVHLGNGPLTMHRLDGSKMLPTVEHSGIRHGLQTARVAVNIENEGPDGVTLRSATLTGPYITSSIVLQHSTGNGYVAVGTWGSVAGNVTVDCDAAAGVSRSLISLTTPAQVAPTSVDLTVDDADGTAHHVMMTLDTTAMALQGQVCVS